MKWCAFHIFMDLFHLQSLLPVAIFSATYDDYLVFPEEFKKMRGKTGLATILDQLQKMFLVLGIHGGCCFKPRTCSLGKQ